MWGNGTEQSEYALSNRFINVFISRSVINPQVYHTQNLIQTSKLINSGLGINDPVWLLKLNLRCDFVFSISS